MRLIRRRPRPEPRSQLTICEQCHDVQTIYVRDMIVTRSQGEYVMATICPSCGQHFAYCIEGPVALALLDLGARWKELPEGAPCPTLRPMDITAPPLRPADLRRFRQGLAEVDTLAEVAQ